MSPAAVKSACYSGTPLAKKLGFKAPMTVFGSRGRRSERP